MHRYKEKKINTKIISFIPKHEKKQQIEFVSDFLFASFCGFNKQNELAKKKLKINNISK